MAGHTLRATRAQDETDLPAPRGAAAGVAARCVRAGPVGLAGPRLPRTTSTAPTGETHDDPPGCHLRPPAPHGARRRRAARRLRRCTPSPSPRRAATRPGAPPAAGRPTATARPRRTPPPWRRTPTPAPTAGAAPGPYARPLTRRRSCAGSGSPGASRRSRSSPRRPDLVLAQNMMYTPHRHGVPAGRHPGRDDRRRGGPVLVRGRRAIPGTSTRRARRGGVHVRRRATPTCPTTRCTAPASAPRGWTRARPRPAPTRASSTGSTCAPSAIDQVIPVGAVPKYVAVTPDDKTVLVTNWCSWDLSVIDVATPPGDLTPCRWTAIRAGSRSPRTAPRRTSP